jgi:uncharacterized protein YbcI
LARRGNAGRADGFFPSPSYFRASPTCRGEAIKEAGIPGTDTPPTPSGGPKSAAISNLTVRLLSQYTGRGPTKARTYVHDDLVTIVLKDTLTKAEQTLVDRDQNGLVLTTRATFQQVMRDDLIAGVEGVLGRKVIAFLSANHIDPDIAVESFILAPAEQGAVETNGGSAVPAKAA